MKRCSARSTTRSSVPELTPLYGVVVASHGTGTGLRAQLVYDIACNEQGGGVATRLRVRPAGNRPGDGIDVVPHPNGVGVIGLRIGQQEPWFLVEQPDWAECPGVEPSPRLAPLPLDPTGAPRTASGVSRGDVTGVGVGGGLGPQARHHGKSEAVDPDLWKSSRGSD